MTAHAASRTARIEALYRRLAPLYDLVYGPTLQDGRQQAMARLAPRLDEWILEVGVGTGFGTRDYPRSCRVAAIDLSAPMITRARARLSRTGTAHVKLSRMDAAHLAFPDASFDAVYAAYVVNVVPDPLAVAREMARVCRPGGRVVLLNHFHDGDRRRGFVDRVLGLVAERAGGADWNLHLDVLLADAGLTIESIDHVNIRRVSSVVVCRRDGPAGCPVPPHPHTHNCAPCEEDPR